MNFKWKWSLDGKNKYSITTKVNGDEYEFNCNLPIRDIITHEAVAVFLYDEKVSNEIIENNPKEYLEGVGAPRIEMRSNDRVCLESKSE